MLEESDWPPFDGGPTIYVVAGSDPPRFGTVDGRQDGKVMLSFSGRRQERSKEHQSLVNGGMWHQYLLRPDELRRDWDADPVEAVVAVAARCPRPLSLTALCAEAQRAGLLASEPEWGPIERAVRDHPRIQVLPDMTITARPDTEESSPVADYLATGKSPAAAKSSLPEDAAAAASLATGALTTVGRDLSIEGVALRLGSLLKTRPDVQRLVMPVLLDYGIQAADSSTDQRGAPADTASSQWFEQCAADAVSTAGGWAGSDPGVAAGCVDQIVRLLTHRGSRAATFRQDGGRVRLMRIVLRERQDEARNSERLWKGVRWDDLLWMLADHDFGPLLVEEPLRTHTTTRLVTRRLERAVARKSDGGADARPSLALAQLLQMPGAVDGLAAPLLEKLLDAVAKDRASASPAFGEAISSIEHRSARRARRDAAAQSSAALGDVQQELEELRSSIAAAQDRERATAGRLAATEAQLDTTRATLREERQASASSAHTSEAQRRAESRLAAVDTARQLAQALQRLESLADIDPAARTAFETTLADAERIGISSIGTPGSSVAFDPERHERVDSGSARLVRVVERGFELDAGDKVLTITAAKVEDP